MALQELYDFFLWEKLFQCSFIKKMLIIQPIPCHFSLSIPPWNHQKSYGFLMFLGGKWHEIINPKLSQFLVIFSVDCFFTMYLFRVFTKIFLNVESSDITPSWRRSLFHDWLLYDRDLRHWRVKNLMHQ